MAIFGLPSADVVPVATDVLSTNVQKENAQRVKMEIEARELPTAPEMTAKDRLRLGGTAPDYSQGFAASNAAQFTSGIPLKG